MLLGACVAFLFFNFNPATLFMGDTGALLIALWIGAGSIETAAELAQRIRTMRDGVVRYLGPPEPELHVASIESNIPVVGEPVVATGRRELTWYLREQAISETVHRYGNLQRLPDSTR